MPEFEPIIGRYIAVDIAGERHRIFIEEAGRGLPLLCLHTAGNDSRQFRHLMNDGAITGRFRVIAIIRDPVALMMSWRSLDLPISRGRLPAGERFWLALAELTRADLDLTEKQLRICDLLLSRFEQLADRIAVVPYEEFVTNPARLLAAAEIRHPAHSQIPTPARPAPASLDHDLKKAALAERIRQLVAAGQLPGIARYYRRYRLDASQPG